MPQTALSAPHWEKLRESFALALECSGEERERIVGDADPEIRSQLMLLLNRYEQASNFFLNLGADIGSLGIAEKKFSPGELLAGRFEIRDFVAQGGMGQVYRAFDRELDEVVALKVLRPELSPDRDRLDQFRAEIRLARQIGNPYVCRVFDVARHSDAYGREALFYAMEFLQGETLSARIRRDGPLPAHRALHFMRQIAKGLEAAQAKQILHLDLKSGNIMLCGEGEAERAVILDFGLARTMSEARTGRAAATPAFAAPERLAGAQPTAAMDVYAAGVIFYHMVTGVLPFDNGSALVSVRSRLTQPVTSPRVRAPELSRRWDKVILRCLAHDPLRRYQSAEELSAALSGSPSRRRVLFTAAAAFAGGGAVAAMRMIYSGGADQSIAVLPFTFDPPDSQYLADGLADRLTDALTQAPGLRVISRRASERYGTSLDRRVPASRIVSGRIQGGGPAWHVQLEMSDKAGVRQWAQTFEANLVQFDGIATNAVRSILKTMRADLRAARLAEIGAPATGNSESYRLYLLGRYHASRRDTESVRESIECLQSAIGLDPGFAAAHSALALSLHFLWPKDGVPREATIAQSNREANRALELDPTLAEAHIVLAANLQNWDWDWTGAEQHFRKAIELKPGSAMAHYWYARMLYPLGRYAEALREINTAAELDPLDIPLGVARGSVLLYQGRVDDAITQYRMVASANPGFANVYAQLSCALEAKGLLQEAAEAAQRAVELTNRASFALSQLGNVRAQLGQTAPAIAIARELEARYSAGMAAAAEVACVYAGLRDRDAALTWMERGVAQRDAVLTILKVEPSFAFLRTEPRFQALMNRVRLQ